MRFQRIAIVLSVLNLLLLVFFIASARTSAVGDVAPILRARVIELVDDKGKTRAQLAIESTGETGLSAA